MIHTRMPKHCRFLLNFLNLLALLTVLSGCSNPSPGEEGLVLMKTGNRMVTVHQYKQAFEMAMSAYPMKALTDRNHILLTRIRLLNQMTDELVMLERADDLGLTVSDEELENTVNRIKKDYPDHAFDQVLIEQAISYHNWKESLRNRLLIEKAVQADIEDFTGMILQNLSPFERYQRERLRQVEHQSGEREKFIREKPIDSPDVQNAFSIWISQMRKTYPVVIDENLWEKIQSE